MKQQRVGVLMGGLSSEREVSLRSGEAVLTALLDRGYHAKGVYVDRDLDLILRQERIEVAFLALHGRWGEDGCVQGLLESMGIPYTGSGVLASALAMHKGKSKELFRLHNVPSPAHYSLHASCPDPIAAHADFGFPCVVKPMSEGSSVGVAICRRPEDLLGALQDAWRFDPEALIERFVPGREISVAILGDRAIGAVEIAPTTVFYDYGAKYTRGAADYYVPPRVSPERYRGILAQALRAHQALGAAGATRVDLIAGDTGNDAILEVNTLPGMTQTSLFPKIAHAAGIPFDELCEMILLGAQLSRQRQWGERRDQKRAFLQEERRTHTAPDHH